MGVGKVEVYRDTPRYITVSGNQLGECKKFHSIGALIDDTKKDTSSSGLFHKVVCELGQKGWSVDRIEQHMRDNPKLYKHTKASQYDSEGRLRQEIERSLKNAGITVREAVKGYTLASLENREFAPLRYYVESFVVEGLTLIAGRPKKGKSWLVFGMGIDIANGDDALGKLTTRQSTVIYYALEDNPRRMKRRAKILLGKNAKWPKNFHIFHDLAKTDVGGLEQIRQHVKEHEAKVVMIDTMTPIRPRPPKGVDPYQHDYDVVSSLQKLAHELRVAIVVTYHTRKAVADDAQESILGSTGITGAVDSWFVLVSNAQGKELHGSGRDIEDVEWGLDPRLNWRWTVTGPAWEARKSKQRQDVLKLLERGEMTVADIAEELQRSVRATTKLLHDMAHSGDIVRKRKGVYARNK
jgi:DNA-binding NarL/FixJ family response regulator